VHVCTDYINNFSIQPNLHLQEYSQPSFSWIRASTTSTANKAMAIWLCI